VSGKIWLLEGNRKGRVGGVDALLVEKSTTAKGVGGGRKSEDRPREGGSPRRKLTGRAGVSKRRTIKKKKVVQRKSLLAKKGKRRPFLYR